MHYVDISRNKKQSQSKHIPEILAILPKTCTFYAKAIDAIKVQQGNSTLCLIILLRQSLGLITSQCHCELQKDNRLRLSGMHLIRREDEDTD